MLMDETSLDGNLIQFDVSSFPDGSLSLKAVPCHASPGARHIRTFHKYDRDASGQLNAAEFHVALTDLGYYAPWPYHIPTPGTKSELGPITG